MHESIIFRDYIYILFFYSFYPTLFTLYCSFYPSTTTTPTFKYSLHQPVFIHPFNMPLTSQNILTNNFIHIFLCCIKLFSFTSHFVNSSYSKYPSQIIHLPYHYSRFLFLYSHQCLTPLLCQTSCSAYHLFQLST